jgi:Flp pilus assembly pilin Flp
MPIFKDFVRDDRGQDLIEYSLLLAFVTLASASLFISARGGINAVWSAANSHLNKATGSTS